jgi:phage-related protein
MEVAYLIDGDLLTNEVEINLNMLCAPVLYRVGGEVDNIDIVTVDKPASAQKIVNLQK